MNKTEIDVGGLTNRLKDKPGTSAKGRGRKILPSLEFNFDEEIGTFPSIYFYYFYIYFLFLFLFIFDFNLTNIDFI